jgi:DNA segregation ATPase FtsK/SpoIIIE-like protein
MGKKLTIGILAAATLLIPFQVKKEEDSLTLGAALYKVKLEKDGDLTISVPNTWFQATRKKIKGNSPLFTRALRIAKHRGRISSSVICKRLGVGASCADAFIEMMEEYGVIEPIDEKAKDKKNYQVVMSDEEIDKLAVTI